MKVIGIHQPGYLPWLGFFKKMLNSDIFVYFDDVSFVKNNYYNRNLIRTNAGPLQLTIPIRMDEESKINDVKIDPTKNWQLKHKKSLLHNYSKAKYFSNYSDFIEELYEKKPEMLKTKESITFDEVLTHQGDLNRYLIDKSLDKIGHFTLNETLSFLDKKINFRFSLSRSKCLEEVYLVRNIIAHNSCIVRRDLIDSLPSGISVSDGEIRLTKAYLNKISKYIYSSATMIEKHVEKKFYISKKDA